jgi:NitT/TauT family transport system permease protein
MIHDAASSAAAISAPSSDQASSLEPHYEVPTVQNSRRVGSRFSRSLRVKAGQLAVFVVIFGTWQLLASTNVLNPFWTSSPSAILHRAYHDLSVSQSRADLLLDVRSTAEAIAIGFALSVVVGLVCGMFLGLVSIARHIVRPVLSVTYALPRIALSPLFVLWFGLGISSRVALTLSVVAFVILINVQDALVRVDRELVASIRTMRSGRWFVARHVYLPTAGDSLFTAMKLGLPLAIATTTVAEMLGASSGIGTRLALASSEFDTTGVFEDLLFIVILAFIAQFALSLCEKRVLRWRNLSEETRAI